MLCKTKTEVPEITQSKPNSISSQSLMSNKKELTIIHGKDEYKLRITGNGKLILTK